jgi:hypothetical protein
MVPITESPTPIPIVTSTQTSFAENPSIPVSGTPTTIALETGLTWEECVVPNQEYAHSMPDVTFARNCLNMEYPNWNDNDRKIAGERTESVDGFDLKQIIENDTYLVHGQSNSCCHYEFSKNGQVIMELDAPFTSFDPSRHLWSIEGKLIWELVTDPPTIFVDGVNYTEKHQLDGIFMPYSIRDKLIYIAKEDGKYHIVFDEKSIGPEFDEIYIRYCCANTQVVYGSGRYWFWGKREGTYYVVGIQ